MSEAVKRETTARALGVALLVALICGLLVSTVAVNLRPLQRVNLEAERNAQLEQVLQALAEIGSELTIDRLEARIVELSSGRFDDSIDAATFDAEVAATRPGSSVTIPGDLDAAGLKRRALHARVYLVRNEQQRIELIILPASGRGYQSTLRAWLVLDGDARTLRALRFYQHGETPGVGARIDEPQWQAKWRDLQAFDDDGVLQLGVRLHGGGVAGGSQVDAISGATRTSQGVDGMIKFWLGEFGFGPFLERLRNGERL